MWDPTADSRLLTLGSTAMALDYAGISLDIDIPAHDWSLWQQQQQQHRSYL
jgi:hypothetical protein